MSVFPSHVPTGQGPAFTYREIDAEGECTLEALASANRFNQWMYETIRPYCAGPVLEIGSGIGNISKFLLADGHEAYLSDLRPPYCRKLERLFRDRPNCRGVLSLDLVHRDFNQAYATWLGRFNTVFALNVVEHVQDDHRAIANCRQLLRPGGTLIILVPAHPFLYNRFDRELGHYRRYTRSALNGLFSANGLQVERSFSFNLAGMLGWFVSGSLLKNKVLPRRQVALYNRLVRLFRILDRLTLRRLGLSVITVGKVPEARQMPAAA
jgi:SAM-dependent methyltransferase